MEDCDPRTSPNARFLSAHPLAPSAQSGSIHGALSVSFLTHAFGVVILILAISRFPGNLQRSALLSNPLPQIVWLPQPGVPQGGGRGSGHNKPPSVRSDQLARPEALMLSTKSDQVSQVPTVPLITDVHDFLGAVTTIALVSTDSQGPGIGDRGSGPGAGPGLGPGRNGGTGDGAYQIGNGVVGPRLINETKPAYTADAMHARVQGVVVLEAVVLPDGSVGRVRIVRSLDRSFGLDDEALRAVKQWRFVPGTLAGRAVPVLVTIELHSPCVERADHRAQHITVASGLGEKRRRAPAELERKSPGVSQHQQARTVRESLLVDEPRARCHEIRSRRIGIGGGEGDVKPQRVHGVVVGNRIGGVAVDLHRHAVARVGKKVDVRRRRIAPDDPHPQVLHVPGGHAGRVRHVAREMFDLQNWHCCLPSISSAVPTLQR
jgi:TonB family protein